VPLLPGNAFLLSGHGSIWHDPYPRRHARGRARHHPHLQPGHRGPGGDARPVYATIGDHSVYTAREARGQGHGAAALRALLDAARGAGLHKLTSRIFTDNAASRRLHERCGFREVGVHLRHARLDGEWRDMVTVEVLLDSPAF